MKIYNQVLIRVILLNKKSGRELFMKILVTGAAGFIGFHLTRRLIKENHQVVGLDNINDYYSTDLKYARLAEVGIQKNHIIEDDIVKSVINRSEEHTSELQSRFDLVCRLLL